MILFIVGVIIGVVGTMAGIGGGIFIVPILFSVYHFSPQLAIGTSLLSLVLMPFRVRLLMRVTGGYTGV